MTFLCRQYVDFARTGGKVRSLESVCLKIENWTDLDKEMWELKQLSVVDRGATVWWELSHPWRLLQRRIGQ